jgi:glycosyltransferase involved in cell wall biosynthesis
MANLLILNHDIPYPQDFSGNATRVLPLSRALATAHNCWLVTFTHDEVRQAGMLGAGVFQSCTTVPSIGEAPSLTRYAYLRTGHLASRRTPHYYGNVLSCIAKLLQEHKIDVIIAHGLKVAEFALGVKVKARIFDATDCLTLNAQRKFIADRHHYGIISYIKAKLAIFRTAYQERHCMRMFDITTLASPVDVAFMRSLCKDAADRVKLIPNGVASTFLARKECTHRREERAVAFWGALDFHPNTTAVRWFYDYVYRPFLRERGIRWYIIGKGAPDDISRYGDEDPNVIVTGFIDDLPSFLTGIPVMVNPMRAGSGIKNKVLEAFAMERVVVSNSMGIESIAAQPDVHYVPAETPEEFCRQIELLLSDKVRRDRLGSMARRLVDELYDWRTVGTSYRKIVEEVLNKKRPEECR